MNKHFVRVFALLLAVCMLTGIFAGCSNTDTPSTTGSTAAPTGTTGSDTVKWSEETTEDGWVKVTNEGGKTLGYSKDSGVQIIEDDGYAFKDLNRNGELDPYEDWRLDDDTRATDLANQVDVDTIFALMVHTSIGGISEDGSDANTFFGASFKGLMDDGARTVLTFSSATPAEIEATWNNNIQEYAEALDFGIPINISSNERSDYSTTNLALAATFDTDMAFETYKEVAKMYRSVGITTLLGPQIDEATEPRWWRNSGTYGEDPALSRDITNAVISALQSTYDENGNDLGWGEDSVIAMMKHWPGDGAGESGREAHNDFGKFTVYPGDGFETALISFVDGGLNLDSVTGESAAVMTSYSIAYDEDEAYGDLVGSAFSEYKVRLLREEYNYDGLICTDWGVVDDLSITSAPWGMEDSTVVKRVYASIVAGVDQIGGNDYTTTLAEAYKLYVEEYGEETANERFRDSARRILKTFFQAGSFDNPYVSLSNALEAIESEEALERSNNVQLASIVMLKNSDNVICQADNSKAEKDTVYIPLQYVTSFAGGSWKLPVNEEAANQYFNIVTDTVDEAGNVVRASQEDLAECDSAIVFVNNPDTGKGYNSEAQTYVPISLQYGEYTADSECVRKVSIAGDRTYDENGNVIGQENRSYYGQSTVASNYSDLEGILYAVENMPEDAAIIVCVNADKAMIFSEFESEVDAILVGFQINDDLFLEVVAGQYEPNGLLPIQMPADMEAVEAQNEDVPRDAECYVDADGNTYDFAFGMNWSGVIDDARTAKYGVEPLTAPQN